MRLTEDDDGIRTAPWLPEEFVHFDGFAVVYSTDDHGDIATLHLPGGRNIGIVDALLGGHDVKLPRFRRPQAYKSSDIGIVEPDRRFGGGVRNTHVGFLLGAMKQIAAHKEDSHGERQ